MSQKKIFLVIVAISTISLLLHHGGHLSWTMEAFYIGCPSLRSHPAPGLKPKHTNVFFLKTHKTASSTMQNLIFRFAERNNLTVGLPVQTCGHQFCYPASFSTHFVHPYTQPLNIITNHMRFNKAELQRIMPNDTKYITILREPGSMFESLFTYYYQYCKSFKRVSSGSLETFLADPQRYYRAIEKDSMYARNTLSFDLGKDKDHPPNDIEYVQAFIAEAEQAFSLVMISEYFDESLVLLRHLLSWDLDDILYFKLNMRTQKSKRSLTPDLVSKIREWNSLDAQLYDYFNASLWRKISDLGTACVAREVRVLRQAQERLMKSCFDAPKPPLRSGKQIKNKELRPWQPSGKVDIMGYDLPGNLSSEAQDLCLKLIKPEVQYSRELLQSQSLRYRQHHPLESPQPSHPIQRSTRKALPRSSQHNKLPAAGPGPASETEWESKQPAGPQGQIPEQPAGPQSQNPKQPTGPQSQNPKQPAGPQSQVPKQPAGPQSQVPKQPAGAQSQSPELQPKSSQTQA